MYYHCISPSCQKIYRILISFTLLIMSKTNEISKTVIIVSSWRILTCSARNQRYSVQNNPTSTSVFWKCERYSSRVGWILDITVFEMNFHSIIRIISRWKLLVGSASFALNHKILQRFPVDKCNCLVHFGGVIYLFPMLGCQVHISSSFKILGMSWRILLYWIFNSLAFSLSIVDLIHSWSLFCCFNNSFRNELCIFCFASRFDETNCFCCFINDACTNFFPWSTFYHG